MRLTPLFLLLLCALVSLARILVTKPQAIESLDLVEAQQVLKDPIQSTQRAGPGQVAYSRAKITDDAPHNRWNTMKQPADEPNEELVHSEITKPSDKAVVVPLEQSSQLSIRHECPTPPEASNKFAMFGDAVRVLNSLDCPYNIHAGTMLNFVRDCVLNDYDVDLMIPLVWMYNNEERLQKAFEDDGFQLLARQGEPNQFGHKLKFTKHEFKVDLFTSLEHDDFYEWALWRKQDGPTRCVMDRTGVEEFQWGNLTLRVPVPFENALRSLYGLEWRKPAKKWHWYQSAIQIGSCVRPNRDKRLKKIRWPLP